MNGKTCPQCSFTCGSESQYCPQCGFPVGAVSLKNEDPLVGLVLPGGYQVLDLLGVGGMGRVYRAEQRALGRTVAVKVIHPHLLSDEKSLARFLTEARATSQLNHPNSVSVIDFGKTEDGQPYLVMEFLRGKNLAQVHAQEGPLPIDRIVNVLKQVLLALGEAHELQMIHRDLKPENIVLEPLRRGGDFVKVVDFGLAKLKTTDAPGITMPGIVCGTPDFMAPEQGRGDPIDGRSDLYAVGVVLFWLLTGRLPFESNSPTQVVLMHISMPLPDPRKYAPKQEIPDAVLAVLHKALAKDAAERFQDAHEFADALEHCASPKAHQTIVQQVEVPSENLECPACSQQVPYAKFCYECGHQLPKRKLQAPKTDPGQLPFTGREEELSWLLEQASRARTEPVTVRVIGESGVGKSRLLSELRARASSAGLRTISVSPDPFWAEVSGYALGALLAELVTTEEFQASEVRQDPEVAAAWQDVQRLPQPEGTPKTPEARRRGYRKLLSWAVTVAKDHTGAGLLITLDDLQRVDGLTRQTLDDYLPRVHASVLFVAAHSPQLPIQWPREKVRLLGGLPSHLATQLLQRANVKQAPITLAEVGNRGIPPLYVDQVLGFGSDGGTNPPARLADLIAHRVSTLEPTLRRLMQALAVLGDEVSKDLLQGMLGDEFVEGAVLERLLRTGMVLRNVSQHYSLVHPLFHELVLLATPAEVRRDLHQKAVAVFQQHEAPLEVLAEHAALAQDSMTALFFLDQVAERALERGDDLTASHSLTRGLDIAREEIYRGELEDPMRAIEIFGRKLGATLNRRGLYSDAEGVLLETLDNAGHGTTSRADVLELLATAAQHRNKIAEAERYARQAAKLASKLGRTEQLQRTEAQVEMLAEMRVSTAGVDPFRE